MNTVMEQCELWADHVMDVDFRGYSMVYPKSADMTMAAEELTPYGNI